MLSCQNMKSLQEICLTHIQWTLEEYPVDVLALLPKAIREEMLHALPIVDICRLEDTHFTSGIDMDSTWKELYESHMNSELLSHMCILYECSWKSKYLWTVSDIILKYGRPYGHSHKEHHEYHLAGTVNYLVAVKLPRVSNLSKSRSTKCFHLYRLVKRHEVIQKEGFIPPAPSYNRTCRSKQLVPPRYRHLFPEGSCYLPDSTALELLGKQCHFCPKEIVICTHIFGTFFQRVDKETWFESLGRIFQGGGNPRYYMYMSFKTR